jgi:hypothetical protein
MTEGFVPVMTFFTEVEAEVAQATLAAAGIESFLHYEDTGHMIPSLQQSEGVKLLVDPKDYDEAMTLLTVEPTESPE